MNNYVDHLPFVALVDDDPHSAQLLTRMLVAHGAPEIEHHASAAAGLQALVEVLNNPAANWPGLVVVDLKAHSRANLEFMTAIQPLLRQKGVNAVVMTQDLDRQARVSLLAAGAAAVFIRHAERDAYRREAADIVSFWARSQRLDAVGM